MYACIFQIGTGFFEGVCRQEDLPPTFRDPPPPCRSRMVYAGGPCWGALAATNLYSPLRYLVPSYRPRWRRDNPLSLLGPSLCRIVYMNFGEFTFHTFR